MLAQQKMIQNFTVYKMTRQLVVLFIAIVIVAIASAFMPVERFVADAIRPPSNKVLTPDGVKDIASTPLWLYAWRITVIFTILLFAAIVATFFVKPNARARWTLAMLSIAAAVFHYLTLLFTSSPPGYGVSIYPLFYTINVKNNIQIYLDIGQVFILYSIYNIYIAEKKLS